MCCSSYAVSVTNASVPNNLVQQNFGSGPANSNVTAAVSNVQASPTVNPLPAVTAALPPSGQALTSMPRGPQSVTIAAANEHMSDYMQAYSAYGPAAAAVSPSQGQLQAEDTAALSPKFGLIPFAQRNYPLMPFDSRLRFAVDPPAGVPEPASVTLILCGGLAVLVARRRNRRNTGA